MVDIHSATVEIRRGKKIEETTGRKYNVRICCMLRRATINKATSLEKRNTHRKASVGVTLENKRAKKIRK